MVKLERKYKLKEKLKKDERGATLNEKRRNHTNSC